MGTLNVEELRKGFEQQEKIAFLVPLKYHPKNAKEPKTCWFKVFIQRDENLRQPEDHFIRENITIIEIKSLKISGMRAIVLIDDKNLSNLLGDSENPAHTQWQKDSQNFLINMYTEISVFSL